MADTNAKVKAQSAKQNNSSSKTSAPSKSSGAKTMAELMQKSKTPLVTVTKSEIVKGRITKLTAAEILVDINAKTEAVVLEKDKKNLRNLLATLHVGDEVTVSVLNPESDSGNPVVSLRRYIEDILWGQLLKKQESQEPLDGVVKEITKGGFIVEIHAGVSGFLPNSQTSFIENAQEIVNTQIKVYVLELNRQEHKVIYSQRAVVSTEEFKKKIAGLKNGQKVDAIITTVTTFGLFVSLQIKNESIDGLIHISEIAWEKTEDIIERFTVGQKIQAVVIRVDYDAKRIDVSLKRLSADPFEELAKQYPTDQKVKASVVKIQTTGVSLEIAQGVEGFIRKEKIPPTVSYAVGQQVEATVSEIDSKRRRIILTPILKEKPIGYR